MKTRNIEHTVVINAPPKEVYGALVDQKKHSKFTGEPAKIRAKIGAAFTCYGTYIKGFVLEMKPNKSIVQAWRGRDWPAGHYSIVTFALTGRSGGKTELHFTQIGVPASDYASKYKGWKSHYWEPLRQFLEQ